MSQLTANILTAARAQIVDRGWRQGMRKYGEKCVCAEDALNRVNEYHLDDRVIASVALHRTLAVQTGRADTTFSLVNWNDLPERTVEDIYALYDKTIADELRTP